MMRSACVLDVCQSFMGMWCNGSTTDCLSVSGGSNPLILANAGIV